MPYTYLGSFLFSSHTKAQNLWLFHNFILGILGPLAIFFIPSHKEATREAVLGVLRFFPQISFSYALFILGFTNIFPEEDDDEGDDGFWGAFDPFSKEIRNSLIYMACEAVGYSILVLLLERYGTVWYGGWVFAFCARFNTKLFTVLFSTRAQHANSRNGSPKLYITSNVFEYGSKLLVTWCYLDRCMDVACVA